MPDENQPEPENGNGENSKPSVYTLLFWIIFCGRMLAFVHRLNYHWLASPGNIAALLESVLTAGGTIALIILLWEYVIPWLMMMWQRFGPEEHGPQAPVPDQPPPKPTTAPPPDEPRQTEYTAVRAPDTTAVTDQPEDWVLIGNKPIYLSDYEVSLDDWQRLKTARRGGRMPDISPTSLQEKIGMGDEAAKNLNAMLMALGLTRDGGHRQPNRWTALGEQVLPASPTGAARVH